MTNQIKTFLLLALLTGVLLVLGHAIGGQNGVLVAFFLSLAMNLGSYWYSDKIVLKIYRARALSPTEAPMLHQMVEELSREASIPTPRLYMVPDKSPNAFATGRDPEHAALAVTEGIVRVLTPEELRGVLAHEIGHVVNRDILIQSVAAVLASTIMYLAHFAQYAAIFGGGRRSDDRSPGGSMLGGLLMAFLAPIAAMLIQMGISRTREYKADVTGAELSKSPHALASALAKITQFSKQVPMRENEPGTAHMFIISPLLGGLAGLFSTHPPVEERIRRLKAMQTRDK